MAAEGWLFVGAGLVIVGVALPLIWRKVKPNRFYGLRVPATFQSERVWYDANAAAGRYLATVGASTIIVAVVLSFIPDLSPRGVALSCAAFLFVGVTVATAKSLLVVRRLTKR